MADGDAAMDAMIASLRKLGSLPKDAAPACAAALSGAIRRQIAAGTDPDGKAWQRTKEGTQPLQNAASALRVINVDATIIARLAGPEARHNNATARGGVERLILPKRGVPPAYLRALRTALDAQFRKSTEVAP